MKKQFTKSDLKDNHIVVTRDEDKCVVKSLDLSKYEENLMFKYDDCDYNDIMEVWEFETLVWKREEPILDEVEKKYLSDVLRPKEIKSQVEHIRKRENRLNGWQDIVIQFKRNKGTLYFPEFEINTMYKGMEVGKEYTLAELGLEN